MRRRRKSTSRLYYADECVPVTSITYLRSRGFSIVLKTTSSTPLAVNKVASKVLKRVSSLNLKGSILYASVDKIRRWKNGKLDEISWKK